MRSTVKNAVRRGMLVIGIAGGITVLGGGIAAASADEGTPPPVVVTGDQQPGDRTSGEDGTVAGNQVDARVEAPVDASGNQVTAVGNGNESSGSDRGGPRAGVSPDADVDHTSGEGGTLSGNQVEVDVLVPVEASGNQVTVIGDDNRSGGSTESSTGGCDASGAGDGDRTSGEDGTVAGNQVDVDVDAPVDVTGNQVTVIGDENRSGGSTESSTGGCDAPGAGDGDRTSGEDGIVSGNQVDADADAPVDATGNQLTVIGDENRSGGSTESGNGGSTGADGTGDGDRTSGEDGILSGNQVDLAPQVPVDGSGNQVTVIGDGNQSGGSTESGNGGSTGADGTGDGDRTSGEDGEGSGNQLDLAPKAPVDTTGNQVTVLGDENESGGSTESAGAGSTEDGHGDRTSGEGGSGSGNQLDLDPGAPVDSSGNQVTVVGDGNQSGGSTQSPDAGPSDADEDDPAVAGVEGLETVGSGGPGVPGAAVLGVSGAAFPTTSALPQTGATGALSLLALLGLCLMLGGLGLVSASRRPVGTALTGRR